MPAAPGAGQGPLHPIDARVKLLAVLMFVILATTLPEPRALGLAAAVSVLLALAARLPGRLILVRLAWVLPFGGIVALLYPFAIPGDTVWALTLGPVPLAAGGSGLRLAELWWGT